MMRRFLNPKGFTLIELLIAVAIIGIMMGIVVVKVVGYLEETRINATKAQIGNLESALKLYYIKCTRYPSTEQGLDALITNPTIGTPCKNYPPGGFLEKNAIPMDPWDNPYQYELPGRNNPDRYDIGSWGKDGESGTDDDIGNWAAPEQPNE